MVVGQRLLHVLQVLSHRVSGGPGLTHGLGACGTSMGWCVGVYSVCVPQLKLLLHPGRERVYVRPRGERGLPARSVLGRAQDAAVPGAGWGVFRLRGCVKQHGSCSMPDRVIVFLAALHACDHNASPIKRNTILTVRICIPAPSTVEQTSQSL